MSCPNSWEISKELMIPKDKDLVKVVQAFTMSSLRMDLIEKPLIME
jgi:hypothetical protein